MKTNLLFSIILCCLFGCGLFFGQPPPGTKIISPESDFQAFEGEARIVLEWMKVNGYYLNKHNEKGKLFYILYIPAAADVPPLYLGANLGVDSWTKGTSDKVTLTVYHDHFMIEVDGIGEASFTFDEDRGLQVYDQSQKDN